MAIFGHFWTLSAKVVTRGAPWVPRHEDPTFLLCLKPLIPYNQGIWAKNAIFEMCQYPSEMSQKCIKKFGTLFRDLEC